MLSYAPFSGFCRADPHTRHATHTIEDGGDSSNTSVSTLQLPMCISIIVRVHM